MTAASPAADLPGPSRRRALDATGVAAVVARGLKVMGRNNLAIIVSGFFEPVLYLASMGIGLGAIVGEVAYGGESVPYGAYIAPALLATSAVNGAIYDSTLNVFFKLRYSKVYDGMLATSLGPFDVAFGEIVLSLIRGLLYSTAFLAIVSMFGLVRSPLALLTIPAAAIVAYGFSAIGFALTSFMKTFQHLDYVDFVMLPMFLLSATFFPIEVYPPAMQFAIEVLPVWHAVDLMRQLTLGVLDWSALGGHVLYFVALGAVGTIVAGSRMRRLFLR